MLTEAWKSLLILESEAMQNINPSFVSLRLRETTAVHGFDDGGGGGSLVWKRGQLLRSSGELLNKT